MNTFKHSDEVVFGHIHAESVQINGFGTFKHCLKKGRICMYAPLGERKWYPPRYVWKWHQQEASHWLGFFLWSHERHFLNERVLLELVSIFLPGGGWNLVSQDLADAVHLLHCLYFVAVHLSGVQPLTTVLPRVLTKTDCATQLYCPPTA